MILIGTAGIPHSCKSRKTEDGVREIARLGLGAMEVEFVRGVKMTPAGAARVREAARETGVALTAHGPYYINLVSLDPETAAASTRRVLDTARRAHEFGGRSITFHAGFYQERDPEAVFNEMAGRFREVRQTMIEEGLTVTVAPELTGKPSQWGSLDELIALGRAVPGVAPCIDFAHYVARDAGEHNDYAGFKAALGAVKKGLGAAALKSLHLHVSGIEWGPRGEKRHLRLAEGAFDWEALVRALVDMAVSGIMICESPVLEEDALVLQKEYLKQLGGKKR
jgi:deoxyribonuclease IV